MDKDDREVETVKEAGRETVWLPGKPIRAFIGGLFLGLGVSLIAHALKLVAFEDGPFTYVPLAFGVAAAVRARLGTPYKRAG